MEGEQLLRCLVVGSTGDGKSSMLDAMLDPEEYSEETGRERPEILDNGADNAEGTTNEVTAYRGLLAGAKRLMLYDSPGVGTEQCPLSEIMAKIKAEIEHGTKIQCIIITASACSGPNLHEGQRVHIALLLPVSWLTLSYLARSL